MIEERLMRFAFVLLNVLLWISVLSAIVAVLGILRLVVELL